ncbi:MAG: Porphobilinogen deaminase, partial [uncultured Friedmanniella sp.]
DVGDRLPGPAARRPHLTARPRPGGAGGRPAGRARSAVQLRRGDHPRRRGPARPDRDRGHRRLRRGGPRRAAARRDRRRRALPQGPAHHARPRPRGHRRSGARGHPRRARRPAADRPRRGRPDRHRRPPPGRPAAGLGPPRGPRRRRGARPRERGHPARSGPQRRGGRGPAGRRRVAAARLSAFRGGPRECGHRGHDGGGERAAGRDPAAGADAARTGPGCSGPRGRAHPGPRAQGARPRPRPRGEPRGGARRAGVPRPAGGGLHRSGGCARGCQVRPWYKSRFDSERGNWENVTEQRGDSSRKCSAAPSRGRGILRKPRGFRDEARQRGTGHSAAPRPTCPPLDL